MQLYIDSFGAFLGIDKGMFWLKPKNNPGQHLAINKVKCIFATQGVQISTDAMITALENEIPLIVIDKIGRSKGFLWSGQFGSVSTIRKNQALFASHIDSMFWMRELLSKRLEGQIETAISIRNHEEIPASVKNLFNKTLGNNLILMERQLKRWQNWLFRKNDSRDLSFQRN